MSISRTTRVPLDAPGNEIDLEAWLFGLSDSDYQACAKGHRGAGVFADAQGRGMVNVESIGGHLIVQHYRVVRTGPRSLEMHSPASRVYLFHLIPVTAGVRWILEVTPKGAAASDFACTVEVHLRPDLGVLARASLLGHFLSRHVDEEAQGFASDITHNPRRAPDALQRNRQEANPAELRSGQQPRVG
jgi:hypothetical protein